MGNLQKWAGPPSQRWIKKQRDLAKNILHRMSNDLGMEPVLPAFAGFLPDQFIKLYPNSDTQQLSTWSHFNCTYSCIVWLEPADPMFSKFQNVYIDEQQKAFGYKAARFALDMFNEVVPKSNDPQFLADTAVQVHQTLPHNSIWVLQGWLFHHTPDFWKAEQIKAFLQGPPIGSILVLDLFAETDPFYNKTESFYGQPFIWCMLGNFGGNTGWYGAIPDIREGFTDAIHYQNTTIVGTAIVPEGLFQNEIVYDYTLQLQYDGEIENDESWITKWVKARYGNISKAEVSQLSKLFEPLFHSVWGHSGGKNNWDAPQRVWQKTPVALRPSLKISTDPSDNPKIVIEQWKDWMLQNPDRNLLSNQHFRFDTIDLTRAALTEIFTIAYVDVKANCLEHGELADSCGYFNSSESIPVRILNSL